MKIAIDTHTHTIASGHAYSTLREMAQATADKKLEGLAITEHAPNMPGSCHLFYFQNIRVVPRSMYGIELLLGVELNILNENGEVDMPDDLIAELDIAIASMHTPCYQGARMAEKILNGYKKAMNNKYIDIIGHPDDARFPVDYEALAKEAAVTGTLLEVNNSSLRPGGFRENARPNAETMLRYCKEYQTMIVVSSDAHVDVDIAECKCAAEVLKAVDFPEELIANISINKLKASLKRNKKL